jgi:pimeloyl-ACP methyl ester carboxylesterase
MKRRWVSVGIAFGVVASVLPAVAPSASARAPANGDGSGIGTIAWGPCNDGGLLDLVGAECGMLSVPLDYKRPRGEKIQIAVSRLEHTVSDSEYEGIALANPGGPGGSGLIYAVLGAILEAGPAYDWIGFDPRGVGSSVPAVTCDPEYGNPPRPPYDPATLLIEATWLKRAAGYALDCGRNNGRLLGHLKTTDNVADMDAIRQALGQDRLSLYGFSYGTYLGQVYATQHPDRVHKMVLDGNVDPRKVWYDANLDQDRGFEVTINEFFAWVARFNDVYGLGTTAGEVSDAFYGERADLTAQPKGALGPAEFTDAMLGAGYYQATWLDIGAAFAALVNDDDPEPMLAQYGYDDNGYAMYLATSCSDAKWPRSWIQWRRDNKAVAQEAPFITWGNAWFNAPCVFWPAISGKPVDVDGGDAPPILLLSETLDAATPYPGSIEVRRRFPTSALIATVGGTTHAGSLDGNACVEDAVTAYLLDGTLPARAPGDTADAECAPLPQPDPTAELVAPQTRTADATGDLRAEVVRQLEQAILHR